MKTTIRMEQRIETPTSREIALADTLRELPEVNVENIPGWPAHCAACDRLAAAEALVKEAEAAMSEASAAIRKYVAANWKPEEINATVRAVLTVW